jgi:AmmeMemoRadiSam system protein B
VKAKNQSPKTREPIADGLFYPEEEQALLEEVNRLLSEAAPSSQPAFAVFTPHAAFQYVGPLLAKAFKSTADRIIETVVVLAPQHRDPDTRILLPESEFFLTPLGPVSVAREITVELERQLSAVVEDESPHFEEISIEVQLPFIQVLHPSAQLVPLLLGELSPEAQKALAEAFRRILHTRWETTLFVITSNMGYYNEGEDVPAETLVHPIRNRDIAAVSELGGTEDTGICGALGLATLLRFEDIRFRPVLLGQSRSPVTRSKEIHYAAFSLIED